MIPKVFGCCQRWPDADKDMISVVLMLPVVRDTAAFGQDFSKEEKRLLWLCLEACQKMTGNDIFKDFDEASTLQAVLLDTDTPS